MLSLWCSSPIGYFGPRFLTARVGTEQVSDESHVRGKHTVYGCQKCNTKLTSLRFARIPSVIRLLPAEI